MQYSSFPDGALESAILNTLQYLEYNVPNGTTVNGILDTIRGIYQEKEQMLIHNTDEIRRFHVVDAAVRKSPYLAKLVISNQSCLFQDKKGPIYEENGLYASCFEDDFGTIYIAFRGTGAGEWVDNGEVLSGFYPEGSAQQIEALVYFETIYRLNGWNEKTNIILSGHSKGANKAQYITMYTSAIKSCYSFDGPGFSPEAVQLYKKALGLNEFQKRSKRIYSISADNDYINVLGVSIVQPGRRYYLKAPSAELLPIKYHYMESILTDDGYFNEFTKQGEISEYIGKLSNRIMKLPPSFRQYATIGLMGIAQDILGRREALNNHNVDLYEKIMGVIITLSEGIGSGF